ncbi:unnamed protein product [Larinioides sclopetarius]|uniref:Uncharacterized protein n=1 Tax=Larinioides sclopetarius TaxID=280406 RepID=A0AAV1YUQ1_9ARAC
MATQAHLKHIPSETSAVHLAMERVSRSRISDLTRSTQRVFYVSNVANRTDSELPFPHEGRSFFTTTKLFRKVISPLLIALFLNWIALCYSKRNQIYILSRFLEVEKISEIAGPK